MDSYQQYAADIAKAVAAFKSLPSDEVIRCVSHFDADGISAAALVIQMLNRANRKYTLTIVPSLKKEFLEQVAKEDYQTYIFSDIGSGMISDIEHLFEGKNVFVLDHHDPDKLKSELPTLYFCNPHKFGIDGGKEISGAGVVYLFAKELDPGMKSFAHVALIGAIGDMQEHQGFEHLNNSILEDAVAEGNIKVIRGLRMFGAQTKPLHKVLEYCTDPYIPGVSGSESGAVQFLLQLGIEPKIGSQWKKVRHLSEDEMKQLVTGVILKRLHSEENPEDVLGNVYLLRNEKEDSPTKDVKEFATLLNACGRLDKASLGIGACLGDKVIKRKAIQLLSEYKKEIINSINWYHDHKDSKHILKGDGYLILNAGTEVRSTIIGTLASIISRSNGISAKFIMSLARVDDGTTKVSLRLVGRGHSIDLKSVISQIVEGLDGCEAGGHQNAAGAIVPTDLEERFIEKAQSVLSGLAMEEVI